MFKSSGIGTYKKRNIRREKCENHIENEKDNLYPEQKGFVRACFTRQSPFICEGKGQNYTYVENGNICSGSMETKYAGIGIEKNNDTENACKRP